MYYKMQSEQGMHFSTFMYLNDLLLIIVNELSSSK